MHGRPAAGPGGRPYIWYTIIMLSNRYSFIILYYISYWRGRRPCYASRL